MSSRSRGSKAPLGGAWEPAFQIACDQIARRARSEAEIRRRLERAGSDPEVIDRVVVRLRELRYLDDEAFARGRSNGLASRGFGPRAVAAKLYQAGIEEGLARSSIEETFAGEEVEVASQALARRLRGRRWEELDQKERARLFRWLAGRGFSSGAITGAIDRDRASV